VSTASERRRGGGICRRVGGGGASKETPTEEAELTGLGGEMLRVVGVEAGGGGEVRKVPIDRRAPGEVLSRRDRDGEGRHHAGARPMRINRPAAGRRNRGGRRNPC